MSKTILLLAVIAIAMPVLTSQAQEGGPDVRRPEVVSRPVTFIDYKESGSWKTWKDERLSIRIPHDVRVAVETIDVAQEADPLVGTQSEAKWVYFVVSKDQKRVLLAINLFRGGPEYVDCFCASKEEHEYTQKDGLKFWALTLPGIDARMFKVASKTMRVDIHGQLPKKDAEPIRYMIESVRPIEPKTMSSKN